MVYFLDAQGTELVIADTRRGRVSDRISLDRPFVEVWQTEDGRFHGLSADRMSIVLDLTGTPTRVGLPAPSDGSYYTAELVVLPLV